MREWSSVHIDGYIYTEIAELNFLDVHTLYCCSGHPGRNYVPYIAFVFSERLVHLLCKVTPVRKHALTIEITRGAWGMPRILVYPKHRNPTVTYAQCRAFKQYLRNILSVIREGCDYSAYHYKMQPLTLGVCRA